MTIYVNGRFLTQRMTGVERYAYKMCKTMTALGQPFIIVCPKAPIQSCYDISDLNIAYWGKGNSHIWEQCVLPFFFIRRKNYLVLSFTGLGSIFVRNKVMTIHDLSFLENPSWFSRTYYWWYRFMTPLAVRTSKHIITVSNFSKNEILRFYPFLKETDISIVYGAVDSHNFYPTNEATHNEKPFALSVSSIDPRKNFLRLIEAFRTINDYQLYIVGSHNRVFTQTDNNETVTSDNIKFLGRVSDDELLSLYNRASCFIFPSIYEGFGLPTIEAMQCGCPVLVSDIPVTHEVCGDAACYFNPYEVKSIRETIIQFFAQPKHLKEHMVAKGHENAQRFSWENSVVCLQQVFKHLSTQK